MPKNKGPYGISGEPWHVEYLRTESDDDRRDKRRCLYYEKGNKCSKKAERCIGSSHCDYYKEKEERPQASRYLHEDGRYYRVKESTEKPVTKSAAYVPKKTAESRGVPYADYVKPVISIQKKRIVRYAPGTEVRSPSLGKGTIQSAEGNHYSVKFSSKVSTFLMDAFDRGYLTLVSPAEMEVKYQVIMSHPLLPAHQVIEGDDEGSVSRKAVKVNNIWNQEWRNRVSAITDRTHSKNNCISAASLMTTEAARLQHRLESLVDNNTPVQLIDFESLLQRRQYTIPEPEYPTFDPIPTEPLIENYGQPRKMGFFQKLLKLDPLKISKANREQYAKDHAQWEENVLNAKQHNAFLYETYQSRMEQWEKYRDNFNAAEEERIRITTARRDALRRSEKGAVEQYLGELLDQIRIPLPFAKEYDIKYDRRFGYVTVGVQLPGVESMPRMKRVVYREAADAFEEEYYSTESVKRLQVSVAEQIAQVILSYIKAGAKQENIILSSIKVNGYSLRYDEKSNRVLRTSQSWVETIS